MAADESLNPALFEQHLPPAPGTAPIPEGTMRVSHYTWDAKSAEGIKKEGILRSKGEESFARGGTEAPVVFASAGAPSEEHLRSGRHYIEGYAHPEQLDVGSHWRGGDPTEHNRRAEANRSTVTFHGDMPASQIVAHHEPWHSPARYLLGDQKTLHDYVRGDYKDSTTGDPHTDEALGRLRHFYRGHDNARA
jgi:hypothetical protein